MYDPLALDRQRTDQAALRRRAAVASGRAVPRRHRGAGRAPGTAERSSLLRQALAGVRFRTRAAVEPCVGC